MIEDNKCSYSKYWQPYTWDYDKFEYDIKTKNGKVVENCYPNAGVFQSMSTTERVLEEDVAEIRFAENPIADINPDEIYK